MNDDTPAHEAAILCLDCDARADVEHDGRTMTVWLAHSETCLAWPHHPARQLGLQMTRESTDTDTEEKP